MFVYTQAYIAYGTDEHELCTLRTLHSPFTSEDRVYSFMCILPIFNLPFTGLQFQYKTKPNRTARNVTNNNLKVPEI